MKMSVCHRLLLALSPIMERNSYLLQDQPKMPTYQDSKVKHSHWHC
jgi:hypothetical protein